MTCTHNNENSTDKRFWELYLVRYLVPSIVSGVCLGYLFLADSFGHSEFTDFKTTIEWLNKNFNTIMFIVWGIVSFAVMYLFSGITMAIHVIRSFSIGMCPIKYYYEIHSLRSKYGSMRKELYKNYRESYRHLREHGTAFEVSLYLIIVTLCINPLILKYQCFAICVVVAVCLLGAYSGSYFGIILEMFFYDKIKLFSKKRYLFFYLFPLIAVGVGVLVCMCKLCGS